MASGRANGLARSGGEFVLLTADLEKGSSFLVPWPLFLPHWWGLGHVGRDMWEYRGGKVRRQSSY